VIESLVELVGIDQTTHRSKDGVCQFRPFACLHLGAEQVTKSSNSQISGLSRQFFRFTTRMIVIFPGRRVGRESRPRTEVRPRPETSDGSRSSRC
jgi:hypothetical protein